MKPCREQAWDKRNLQNPPKKPCKPNQQDGSYNPNTPIRKNAKELKSSPSAQLMKSKNPSCLPSTWGKTPHVSYGSRAMKKTSWHGKTAAMHHTHQITGYKAVFCAVPLKMRLEPRPTENFIRRNAMTMKLFKMK
jgi:hypothetical protein